MFGTGCVVECQIGDPCAALLGHPVQGQCLAYLYPGQAFLPGVLDVLPDLLLSRVSEHQRVPDARERFGVFDGEGRVGSEWATLVMPACATPAIRRTEVSTARLPASRARSSRLRDWLRPSNSEP